MILTAVSIRERHKHHWWSTRTTCQLIPIKFNETHEMSKAKLLLFFSISSDSWSNLIEEKVVQMKTTEREREKGKRFVDDITPWFNCKSISKKERHSSTITYFNEQDSRSIISFVFSTRLCFFSVWWFCSVFFSPSLSLLVVVVFTTTIYSFAKHAKEVKKKRNAYTLNYYHYDTKDTDTYTRIYIYASKSLSLSSSFSFRVYFYHLF